MISRDKKADLHLHSVYSDGTFSPTEVIELASRAGLSAVSIVDHDNILGLEESEEAARKVDIEVIPGVELSSNLNQKEVHILGYFIDRKNRKLNDYLAFFRDERKKRAERIVKKLNSLNIPLKIEAVLRRTILGSIGRPHVAYALLEDGFIDNYDEAFDKYIGLNGPAYEEKIHFSPKDAIELISQAGGLSILAHPNKTLNENELLHLIDIGIDGIEVIHPSHSSERINYFKGRKRDEEIMGRYAVDIKAVDNMKRRLFK